MRLLMCSYCSDLNTCSQRVFQEREQFKKKTDALQLEIQNLKYEGNHLLRQISACKSFSSRHEKLELISLDVLKERAPHLLDTQNGLKI